MKKILQIFHLQPVPGQKLLLRTFHLFCIISILSIFIPGALGKGDLNDPLTSQEREWLSRNKNQITLAIETKYAPFVFIDKNGKCAGLAMEYIELIEDHIGFKFKRARFKSLDEILGKAEKRELEIVNAVTETPSRSEYLLFTRPFIEIPNVIIVNKSKRSSVSLDKMKGMKVSLVRNYAITEYLRKQHPDMDVDLVPDDLSALLNVSFNKSDSAIIDLATATYFIKINGITNLQIAGNADFPIKLSIASRKDMPMLNQILDKGLSSISETRKQAISDKWFSLGNPSLFESWIFWIFIATVLITIVLIIAWNRALKREVDHRTRQLQKELLEHRQTEISLKESEETFRATVERSPLAIYISIGIEQKLEYINPKFIQLFGYTKDDVPDLEHWLPLAYPNEQYRKQLVDEWQSKVRRALETNSNIEPMESVVTCKDGSTKNILWGFIPMGRKNYAYGLDLTERKMAEKKQEKLQELLLQSQKMDSIGRLAGGVAHDFNNMLTAILGHVELSMTKIPQTSPAFADLQEIQKAAERSAELTRQLLGFARKQIIVPKVLDLNESVEGMLKMLRRIIKEEIVLDWKPCSGIWKVRIDSSQLNQILTNLCVNSRHAISGPGRITIATGNISFGKEQCSSLEGLSPGDFVHLSVSDTGCGMDKETLSNIFEPFFTTKNVGEGIGLGLATVYGIVKQNNGLINVTSEPGKGTTFDIYLPRFTGEPENIGNTIAAVPAGGNETILLVEDEAMVLALIRLMLEELGYRVIPAVSPGEAISKAKGHSGKIHLLITDVIMPEMNGSDLSKRLMYLHPEMKCLFMSGYTASIVAQYGVLEGGIKYIQKPFMKKELAQKVLEALGKC